MFIPDRECVDTIDLNGEVREALVKPFWSQWSRQFLHSSDIVLATAPVLKDVIGSEDKITSVDAVRFLKPTHSCLDTYTRVLKPGEEIDVLFSSLRGKPTYTFAASTLQGKRIGMVGYDSNQPVDRSRHWKNESIVPMKGGFFDASYRLNSEFSCTFYVPLSPAAPLTIDPENPSYFIASILLLPQWILLCQYARLYKVWALLPILVTL